MLDLGQDIMEALEDTIEALEDTMEALEDIMESSTNEAQEPHEGGDLHTRYSSASINKPPTIHRTPNLSKPSLRYVEVHNRTCH